MQQGGLLPPAQLESSDLPAFTASTELTPTATIVACTVFWPVPNRCCSCWRQLRISINMSGSAPHLELLLQVSPLLGQHLVVQEGVLLGKHVLAEGLAAYGGVKAGVLATTTGISNRQQQHVQAVR